MKTSAIIRIILFTVLILVLVSVLAMSVMGFLGYRSFYGLTERASSVSSVNEPDAPQEGAGGVVQEANMPVEGITEIEIQWVSGHVTVETGDVEEIRFSETPSDRPMYWFRDGDTLTIRFWEGKWPIIGAVPGKYRKDLKVIVPRDWAAEEISIEAVEADVDIRDLVAEELEFDGVSGKFHAENCQIGELDMDTVSGSIDYSGSLRELDVDSVSADCTLVLTNVPGLIEMDGVSGDLDVTLPVGAGLDIKLDSVSGKLVTDFPGTQSGKSFRTGDGACRITVSGVSGGVRVNQAK